MKKGIYLLLLTLCAGTISAQRNVIDSLQRIESLQRHDSTELKVLLNLTNEFLRTDFEKAKYYGYRSISLARSLQISSNLSSGYSHMVMLHQNTGQIDSASYYLTLMDALAKNYPSDGKIKINYCSAAGLFYKNQGKYREALPFLLEAVSLNNYADGKVNRAGQLLNIGNTYYLLSNLKKAAEYHLNALGMFEELNNKRGQSFCYQSLGNDFFELKQYSTAKKYLLQSEKLKEELEDRRGILTSWMTLGSVYQQTNSPELSMLYYNKALTRARELSLTLEEARVLFNMGSLLKSTKRSSEAGKAFSEALPLARQSGDSLMASRIKTYMVALQNDIQNEKKEEQTLSQNVKISQETGALQNTAEGHFALAKWYASRRQFEEAFNNQKRGQEIYDSIGGSEVVTQLRSLEEDYKNQKKEREIALLKKDQELQSLALSRQRALNGAIIIGLISLIVIGLLLVNRYRVMNNAKRLLEIEKVRNNIARDLHDDIGSTLSSINILSQVALVEQNGNTQNYLQRIGDQSSRMMEDMSDMVWSINPRNDSMEKVITRMREFATEIFESSGIEYRFSEKINGGVVLDAERRKNLFLIFKEAINNAAKYSKANTVDIDLQQQNDTLILKVKDNGKGFDEQKVNAGNGLRNLRERAKEVNGTITLSSTKNKGTELELQLPLA